MQGDRLLFLRLALSLPVLDLLLLPFDDLVKVEHSLLVVYAVGTSFQAILYQRGQSQVVHLFRDMADFPSVGFAPDARGDIRLHPEDFEPAVLLSRESLLSISKLYHGFGLNLRCLHQMGTTI